MIAEKILEKFTPNDLTQLSLGISMEVQIWLLEQEPLFLEEKEVKSMESLALTLMGNSPITRTIFSHQKFKQWCEGHFIQLEQSPNRPDSFILRISMCDYWRNRIIEKTRKRIEYELMAELHQYYSRNATFQPIDPSQVKRISKSNTPFIEDFYINGHLLLRWDYERNIRLN